MMRRRILLWIGLGVLFLTMFLGGTALAKESYTVRTGDTLTGIAAKHGVTLHALKAANHLKGNRVRAHQTLIIPQRKTGATVSLKPAAPPQSAFYTVQKGDTLTAIARKTDISVGELREINQIGGSTLKIGQKLALSRKSDVPEACDLSLQDPLPAEDETGSDEADGMALSRGETLPEAENRNNNGEALLGKWNGPDEQRLLVKVAMGFLGAPYRMGGSSVTGIDCSGFVKKIYEFFNIDLPRTAYEQSRVGMRVSRHELAAGDLLFFNTRRNVGHVGIYIGNNKFVHACSRKKGVRVDNLSTPYYDRRFIRAVRLKGSEGDL